MSTPRPRIRVAKLARNLAFLSCAALCANHPLRAGADTAATADAKSADTEEQPIEYKNWIELGIGGVITDGDRAQFEQEHRLPGDQPYGGIQDLHYERDLPDGFQLAVDGHALWDFNDYDVKVDISKAKLGYLRFGYDEFRSWYDGNGGFFPPHGGTWFPPEFPEMHIDRGEAWIELGLRVPDWPEITLRYSHEFRDGMKDSTTWGDTDLTGLAINPNRKIIPSFRDIDETRDIVALDITKTFGNTDVLIGMRYEHSDNDDSLNMERGAGELPPVVAPPGSERFVTQRENDRSDLFSGHTITETRFSDSLWFTAGYAYTTLESDLAGTRIIGSHFDAGFQEPILTLQPFDEGFLNLAGTTQMAQNLFTANVFWLPLKNLSVITAFRYTQEHSESDSTFLFTDTEANTPPFTRSNPMGGFHQTTPVPTSGNWNDNYNTFNERLELRYVGIPNWLLYAEGEWEEEEGDVYQREQGGIDETRLNKETQLLDQKYSLGANWYPMDRLDVSAQYYHQFVDQDGQIHTADHQRLVEQDWNTDDVNVRITCRPKIPTWLGTLALISRYDFVRTEIDTQWQVFGNGEILPEQQSGIITKHVITESITWYPLARLYLQTNVSYVLDQTETPASQIDLIPNTSATVVNFRNDYWTVTAGAGFLLDDKTNLEADYSFYRATDYFKNSRVAVPYGMGATEHTLSAGVGRQINKQIRLTLKYTYFNYTDETYGGHNDYEAHSIFSGLQYRF
jgi:hypothetical protein